MNLFTKSLCFVCTTVGKISGKVLPPMGVGWGEKICKIHSPMNIFKTNWLFHNQNRFNNDAAVGFLNFYFSRIVCLLAIQCPKLAHFNALNGKSLKRSASSHSKQQKSTLKREKKVKRGREALLKYALACNNYNNQQKKRYPKLYKCHTERDAHVHFNMVVCAIHTMVCIIALVIMCIKQNKIPTKCTKL